MKNIQYRLTLSDIMPFGKWKGWVIDRIIPSDDDNFQSPIFGLGDGLNYMQWVDSQCTNVELQQDVKDRIASVAKARHKMQFEWAASHPKPCRKNRSLDHYNDIGAMNDLSFQDVYGDFGF